MLARFGRIPSVICGPSPCCCAIPWRADPNGNPKPRSAQFTLRSVGRPEARSPRSHTTYTPPAPLSLGIDNADGGKISTHYTSQSLHKNTWSPASTPALAGRCFYSQIPIGYPMGCRLLVADFLPSLEDPPTMGILLGRAWQTHDVRPEDVS